MQKNQETATRFIDSKLRSSKNKIPNPRKIKATRENSAPIYAKLWQDFRYNHPQPFMLSNSSNGIGVAAGVQAKELIQDWDFPTLWSAKSLSLVWKTEWARWKWTSFDKKGSLHRPIFSNIDILALDLEAYKELPHTVQINQSHWLLIRSGKLSKENESLQFDYKGLISFSLSP